MSSPTTLSQWVGVRKGVSQRATSQLTTLHKRSQRPSNYDGLSRKYKPADDDGMAFPPESKTVVLTSVTVLEEAASVEEDWWDVIATCEAGNALARANLVVDGKVLFENATVPILLFLDKRLKDLRVFVEKMPVLDANETWTQDPNSTLFRADRSMTHKTKKVQKPVVLYPATEEHPAQTQLITEDVIIGWWETIRMSGALPAPRQKVLLGRLDKLIRAVKFAVEEANRQEVHKVRLGEPVLGWLFA